MEQEPNWTGPAHAYDTNASNIHRPSTKSKPGGRGIMDSPGDEKRPIYDYQKILGHWAEERDVTRELLSQHKGTLGAG